MNYLTPKVPEMVDNTILILLVCIVAQASSLDSLLA